MQLAPREGVTFDAIKEFATKEVEVINTIHECHLRGEQALMHEKAIMNEVHRCGAGHMAINKALNDIDAGLVEGVFSPGYADMRECFKQGFTNVRIGITDVPTKVALPIKSTGNQISITKTLADAEAKVPDCSCFGLHERSSMREVCRCRRPHDEQWCTGCSQLRDYIYSGPCLCHDQVQGVQVCGTTCNHSDKRVE